MSWRTLFTVTAPPIALEASRTVVTAPRTVPMRLRTFAALSARPVWAELWRAATFSTSFTTEKGIHRASYSGITRVEDVCAFRTLRPREGTADRVRRRAQRREDTAPTRGAPAARGPRPPGRLREARPRRVRDRPSGEGQLPGPPDRRGPDDRYGRRADRRHRRPPGRRARRGHRALRPRRSRPPGRRGLQGRAAREDRGRASGPLDGAALPQRSQPRPDPHRLRAQPAPAPLRPPRPRRHPAL